MNAAPYLHGVHKPFWLSTTTEETVPPRAIVCTSLTPRPMTVGLWSGNEAACAHAYKVRKWRPTQWTAAWQCFIDLGKLEAMKTLSGRRAGKHWFCAKITVSA